MRVFWVSIAVILLDQCSKYALQFTQQDYSISLVPGWLTLVAHHYSAISAQQLNAALFNSTSWLLLGGLLSIHLLISRWNSLFHFTTIRTIVGLQLAIGGAFSFALDYLLRGSISSSTELHFFERFTFNTGIAELALTLSLPLLIYVLLRGSSQLSCRITLLRGRPATLDLSPLSRGVDNIHIDVQLSPEFCRVAKIVVQQVVNNVLSKPLQQRNRLQPPAALFAPLKRTFHTLHQDALLRAKGSGEPQLIDLLYIAVMKFIHSEVSNCVAARLQQAKETIQDHNKRGIGRSSDGSQMEYLFGHQGRFVAYINQMLLDGLVMGELVQLQRGIRGILGKKRSFAMEALQAPLVTANAPDSNEIQLQHYLLFGHSKHRGMSFLQFNQVLEQTLHDYLDLIAEDDSDEAADSLRDRDLDSDNSTAEILARPSVLAHPMNLTILFDQQWTREKIGNTSPFQSWRKYRKYRYHLGFQLRLLERVVNSLRKAGLARWLVTVYEVRALLAQGNSDISPGGLITLMVECDSRKEMQQRLDNICRHLKSPPDSSQVLQLWEKISRQEEPLLHQHLQRFINDFSRYRRDLLLLYRYHSGANQLTLQSDPKVLQTSRANFTLYEFLLPTEKTRSQSTIRSHIIIKADLRGSTEVTDRLNQLALNPATHFDRHFFSPINEVINTFGAEKVFIEGDAIILILNDYAGDQGSHLIASRACGLAAGILDIVARQNRELACYGLPELELGIGIAYSKEPPRFLFDGDHKITISPGINRADRLSACAWAVRNWRERLQAPATQVEVYQPSQRALGHGEKAQKDLIYNLNGILIEAEIFELLQRELSPKRIVNNLPGKQDSRLFAIRIPGSGVESHTLVIRKAPVKVYDPEYQLDNCPVVEGRFFYEVIYKPEIIDSLRSSPRTASA